VVTSIVILPQIVVPGFAAHWISIMEKVVEPYPEQEDQAQTRIIVMWIKF